MQSQGKIVEETVAEDIHLSVAEYFADGSIVIGRYVLYNGGKYEERCLNEW